MTFGSVIVGESSATVCGSDIQRQELLISMLDARIAFARRDRGPIEGMRPRDLFRATAHRVTDSGVKEFAAITAIPHRRVQVLIAAMKSERSLSSVPDRIGQRFLGNPIQREHAVPVLLSEIVLEVRDHFICGYLVCHELTSFRMAWEGPICSGTSDRSRSNIKDLTF